MHSNFVANYWRKIVSTKSAECSSLNFHIFLHMSTITFSFRLFYQTLCCKSIFTLKFCRFEIIFNVTVLSNSFLVSKKSRCFPRFWIDLTCKLNFFLFSSLKFRQIRNGIPSGLPFVLFRNFANQMQKKNRILDFSKSFVQRNSLLFLLKQFINWNACFIANALGELMSQMTVKIGIRHISLTRCWQNIWVCAEEENL